MVGVNSEITATIANLGVRNMTDSEGTKLEVTFYTSSPFTSKLATINVDKALDMGETTDVSIPFKFLENAAYRFIVKVDESQEIDEGTGGPELNNEAVKNSYAVSSVDAYVSDMTVDVGDGLAGKECPVSFEVGVANIPEGGTYRLHFNVSVDGTFGWGEVLGLATQNSDFIHSEQDIQSVVNMDILILTVHTAIKLLLYLGFLIKIGQIHTMFQ